MTRCALVRLPAAVCFLLSAAQLDAATVSGRVLDPAGAPVAGAKVVWEAYRSDEDTRVDETRGVSPAALGETATDSDGKFRVTIERTGAEYSIRVLPASLPAALLEGPFDSSEDVALEVIQLPPAEKAIGRVTDEAGKPVSGAKVRVTAGFPFGAADVTGPVFYAEGSSGADGSFAIPNAPADASRLTVRAPGFSPALEARLERRGASRVTLRAGGTVQGIVLDPAGKPAEGAVVFAGSLAARTDAAGAYRLTGVRAGSQAVEALWKSDFAARKDTVPVRRNAAVDVSLRLARAAAVTGTVVDEKSRRPIAGARVSATASQSLFALRDDEPARRVRTDGKGRFRLSGLAPRSYSIRASRSDYLPATMPGVTANASSPSSVSIALQRAAAIAGRVVDEKGKGVAGARVRLARDANVRAMIRGGPRALLGGQPEARTGPDGSFRLGGLAPARNLTVEAARTGFVPAARHGITLRAGETVKDVALVLKQGLEAKGRVVDAAGQPLAGAEVRLSRPEAGGARMMVQLAGGQRERPDAVTGPDGGFRLQGLEPGEYALTVSREGFAAKRVPLVSVQAEGPNEWPPIALSGGVAIAGSVRNSRGEPVPGADVVSYGDGGGARQATSDAEGKFRLEGLSSERPVMLNVWAEGHGTFSRRVTPPIEDLAVVLKLAGTIRGRVQDAATQRPVSDFTAGYTEPRGGGFAGGIRMMRAGGTPSEKAFQSPDGSFELTDVPAGKWNVTASAPGYRPSEIAGIEVGEGETKESVVLSLAKGGVVTGRVLDPRRGTGVPNASVSWSEGSDASGFGPAAMAMARLTGDASSAATDADGRFRLEGLPAGRITLTAEHPDFLEASRQIELDDDANVDITLAIGGTVSGSVVGRDGRSPIAGAQVVLDEQGATFGMAGESTRSDGSGSFLFENLKPGRYRVSARSSAGSTVAKEVVLAESQQLGGVLLELATGATVRGTVSGLPASRLAGVRVFGSSRDFQDSAITDDQGRFVLRDVPAGLLRLNAIADMASMRSTSTNLDVPDGAPEVPVEIVFEGGSRLSGRVTRGETPISGIFVSAAPDPPASGAGRASDQTDEDGRYSIEMLSDGDYQVSLTGQGVGYRRRFTVSGDTNGDIALPEVSISGTVSDSGSREPIAGASIEAEKRNEEGGVTSKGAVTDSRGFYSIADVDPGAYSVTARKDGYQLKTQTVAVSSSPVSLDLSLARGEGLAVKAVDGLTGIPLRSLAVLAYSAAGTAAYSGSVSLDSEGKGEIPSLSPGLYSLHVYSSGYAARSFPSVQVPSGTLGLALTPGGRVEIRSDVPVTGRLVDAAGSAYLFFPFRRDGRVTVPAPVAAWERVAPGSYRLIVAGASGERSYPFSVAEGRTTTIELR